MGWTEYPPGRIATRTEERDEITGLLTWESDISTTQPLKLTKVGSVWYAAVQVTPKPGLSLLDRTYALASDGSYTFAAVFLTARAQGCWRTKDMSEDMGPVESRAPVSILKLLSPIKDPNSYAIAWRQRCEDWANRPTFQTGDRVKLANPIQLQSGITVTECVLTTYQRGTRNLRCYRDVVTGTLFRMGADGLFGAQLVSSQRHAATDVLAEFAARQAAKQE